MLGRSCRDHFQASGLGWADKIPPLDVAKVCLVARLESGHTQSQHPEYWIPSECSIPGSRCDVGAREGSGKYLAETKEMISPRGMAELRRPAASAGTVILSPTDP